jgi:filamentous hemagglutinin family protein
MRQGRTFRSVLLATSALVPLGLVPAHSNPQGGQVVGGSASIATQGSTTTITQTTDRAVINWNTFNIGSGETTRFIQPNAGSIALNRVTGGLGPSTINGTLTANGQVWIINPAGILIGNGAVVNTAGFLATTSDIKNSDFMAGRYNFIIPGQPDASVVNLGTITATNSGFAALVAPGVRNSGTITARFGKISLASANAFSLDFYGDSLITLGVGDSIAGQVKDVATGQTLDALVKNEGLLKANGGKVELTAVAARQVVDSVINNKGVIEARSIGHRNGMIVLGAATSKTKVAGAPVQTVKVSGTLNVSGKKTGGTVKVTGEAIELASANIKATGGTGGGTVMIGGDTGGGNLNSITGSIPQAALSSSPVPTADTVSVDKNSKIDVSATNTGDGGKTIVWSDTKTVFAGTVLAKGGAQSGNGGFIEVSGKQTLAYSGKVDTSAANGAFGTLLLDPYNLTISSSPSSGMSGFNANADDSVLYVGDLTSALATSNVIVTTGNGGSQAGDITVAAFLAWNSGSTLTLSAYRNIVVNSQGPQNTATINPLGSSSLVLRADNTGTGVGTVLLQNETGYDRRIDATATTGKVTIYYNPANYGAPTDFTSGNGGIYTSTPSQLTAYMLVNNATQLQNVATNLTGAYALGKDIDASATASWNSGAGFAPIGSQSAPFIGAFDGGGHTVDGLTMAPTGAFANYIGLFGGIGSAGVVRNLNITNASITANQSLGSFDQYVGVLAGVNFGTIDNVTVQGTINGGNATNLTAGGLVGRNGAFLSFNAPPQGLIQNSAANVAVNTGNGLNLHMNTVGGLVGDNPGSILNSSATGNIVVGSNTIAGGLVGRNAIIPLTDGPQPLIQDSWASGNVTADNSGGNVNVTTGVPTATTFSSARSSRTRARRATSRRLPHYPAPIAALRRHAISRRSAGSSAPTRVGSSDLQRPMCRVHLHRASVPTRPETSTSAPAAAQAGWSARMTASSVRTTSN